MNEEYPRVLIGVVTYSGKDYIFDRCMNHIYNIDYPKSKVDVMIVDNSLAPDYFFKLKRRGYKNVFRVERGPNSREALTKSQNKIRIHMLEGNYDYLLLIESDLLVPTDTIKRLLSHQVPVVGSTYIIGTGNTKVPCIFVDDLMIGGFRGTRPIGLVRDEISQQRHYDGKEIDEFLSRPDPLQPCHGCGFGCTLISRKIVEDTPFWCDNRLEDKHSDVYFYLDMARQQVPVFVDISVIVPHFPTDWSLVRDR